MDNGIGIDYGIGGGPGWRVEKEEKWDICNSIKNKTLKNKPMIMIEKKSTYRVSS